MDDIDEVAFELFADSEDRLERPTNDLLALQREPAAFHARRRVGADPHAGGSRHA